MICTCQQCLNKFFDTWGEENIKWMPVMNLIRDGDAPLTVERLYQMFKARMVLEMGSMYDQNTLEDDQIKAIWTKDTEKGP